MLNKRKKSFIFLTVLIIFMIGLFLLTDYLENELNSKSLKITDPIPERSRLLVIAPHCDDETLSTFGLIKQVLAKRGEVKIVVVTNGDGFRKAAGRYLSTNNPKPKDYINLGYIRQQETLSAMNIAGVKPENVIFLGYPDGGTSSLWFKYWTEEDPYFNLRTQTDYSPYANSFRPNVRYTGENLSEDLVSIMKAYNPTIVAYPHSNDQHPDHWASHAFVKYALNLLKIKPIEWQYLVHWGGWPAPLGKRSKTAMRPPHSLNNTGTDWRSLPLTKEDIQNKQQAIKSYDSQLKVMGRFLYSFDRKNELYGGYPSITWSLSKKYPSDGTTIIQNPSEANIYSKTKALIGIQSIALSQTEDSIELTLKIREKMIPKYDYSMGITLFQDNRAERVHISALEHEVNIKNFTPSSETPSLPRIAESITTRLSSDVLRVIIPKDKLTSVNTLLIDGRVSHGRFMIDQTPCRVVNIEP